MQCEICGRGDAANIIELNGNELIVCKNCAGFGKEIKRRERPKQKPKEAAKHKPKRDSFIEEIESITLVNDYAKLVKGAREKKGLTIKELAGKIFEKESVLHKIEQGRFIPENKLLKKLEKFLGIDLIEEIGEVNFKQKKQQDKVTLGDLVKKQSK